MANDANLKVDGQRVHVASVLRRSGVACPIVLRLCHRTIMPKKEIAGRRG